LIDDGSDEDDAMTPEQKAAYIVAMVACANAEIAAMQAANQQRLVDKAERMAYMTKRRSWLCLQNMESIIMLLWNLCDDRTTW
jgi:hypothetical protein